MTRKCSRGLTYPARGRAEDIAGLVLFIASDLAGIITGSVYPVEGAAMSVQSLNRFAIPRTLRR